MDCILWAEALLSERHFRALPHSEMIKYALSKGKLDVSRIFVLPEFWSNFSCGH